MKTLPESASLCALSILMLAGVARADPPPAEAPPSVAPVESAAPPPSAEPAESAAPPPSAAPAVSAPPPPSAVPAASPPPGPPPPGMVAGFQTMPPTWTLPQKLPYRDGDLVPKGYHVEERRRPLLLIFGGLLMISSYGLCAAFAGSGLKNAEYGYIPFVGPFIATAKVETYKGDTTLASFIVAGIGELAGAGLLAYGVVATEPWLVRNKEQAKKAAQLYVAPTFGKSSGGLGVVGSF